MLLAVKVMNAIMMLLVMVMVMVMPMIMIFHHDTGLLFFGGWLLFVTKTTTKQTNQPRKLKRKNLISSASVFLLLCGFCSRSCCWCCWWCCCYTISVCVAKRKLLCCVVYYVAHMNARLPQCHHIFSHQASCVRKRKTDTTKAQEECEVKKVKVRKISKRHRTYVCIFKNIIRLIYALIRPDCSATYTRLLLAKKIDV